MYGHPCRVGKRGNQIELLAFPRHAWQPGSPLLHQTISITFSRVLFDEKQDSRSLQPESVLVASHSSFLTDGAGA